MKRTNSCAIKKVNFREKKMQIVMRTKKNDFTVHVETKDQNYNLHKTLICTLLLLGTGNIF